MKEAMEFYRAWASAAALAFWRMAYDLSARDAIPRLWFAALLICKFFLLRRDTVLGGKRSECCGGCPMFHAEHQTCGVIGDLWIDPELNREVPFGCWCFLPAATQIPSKDCWARAQGLEIGWPDKLRPGD